MDTTIQIDSSSDDSDIGHYQPITKAKQRVAHKPTTRLASDKRPKVPLGISRKVPSAARLQGLGMLIDEYLKIGTKEDVAYKEALSEEKKITDRATTRMIYLNLIAVMVKKIRDKAGVKTVVSDNDNGYVNGNKVVSHSEILTGKVRGTFSIQKRLKVSDPKELTGSELYTRLLQYVMPESSLTPHGYPSEDPDTPGLAILPSFPPVRLEPTDTYTCDRCKKIYKVDEFRMPISQGSACVYHSGRLWNQRVNKSMEKRYSCCKGDINSIGCSSSKYHVHRGEFEIENRQGFVCTQPKFGLHPANHGIYALDCEMCYTTLGLELTRITVIDHQYKTVYEKLVKPNNTILDYNSKFSGINEGDLDGIATTLPDVQTDLLELFSTKTVLVGHSLESDLKALKLIHKNVIDTAQVFPHKRGLPYKRALRTLMQEYLMKIIQEDSGHDSKEDATACMQLVMWKAKDDGVKRPK